MIETTSWAIESLCPSSTYKALSGEAVLFLIATIAAAISVSAVDCLLRHARMYGARALQRAKNIFTNSGSFRSEGIAWNVCDFDGKS